MMKRTISLTIHRTLTLDQNAVEWEMTDEELIKELSKDYDDWWWEHESVKVEIKPTTKSVLGE